MASLRSFELLAPLVPLFLESRKDEFQVAADVFAAVHRMRERDTPNTPAARVEPTDLCHRDFVGDLPHKASPAIVRGDNECVSFLAELSLKVRNFSERESFHDAIFEHLKAMVDQCTGWSRDECRLAARSTYRIGVDSKRSPSWSSLIHTDSLTPMYNNTGLRPQFESIAFSKAANGLDHSQNI